MTINFVMLYMNIDLTLIIKLDLILLIHIINMHPWGVCSPLWQWLMYKPELPFEWIDNLTIMQQGRVVQQPSLDVDALVWAATFVDCRLPDEQVQSLHFFVKLKLFKVQIKSIIEMLQIFCSYLRFNDITNE